MRADFELLTRSGCHLCNDMQIVLERVLGEPGEGFRITDVDDHPELAERFGDTVPVLRRDGKAVAKVRLSERQLRRIVRRRRSGP